MSESSLMFLPSRLFLCTRWKRLDQYRIMCEEHSGPSHAEITDKSHLPLDLVIGFLLTRWPILIGRHFNKSWRCTNIYKQDSGPLSIFHVRHISSLNALDKANPSEGTLLYLRQSIADIIADQAGYLLWWDNCVTWNWLLQFIWHLWDCIQSNLSSPGFPRISSALMYWTKNAFHL